MAVTVFTGFEGAAVGLDGITLTGTAAYSTTQARTGTRSIRCNPASGANGYITLTAVTSAYVHFGLYIATLPSVARFITGSGPAIKLNTNGTLSVGSGSSFTPALSTGQWYWIGMRITSGTGDAIQVNGTGGYINTDMTPTTFTQIGFFNSEASAADIYIDDIVIDGAGFLQPSKVIDLLPTADSAIGTGWTLGSGGTSNLFGGVDNQPPTAVADAGTTAQIRNATSNANSNYDATLQTYTVGGVGASDTVLAVQNVIATAAPVTTSAKQGTVGNVSNPAITNIALASGGTAGAFWSGVAGGTYPTGWKVSRGTFTTSPSVTKGTAPVMRVTQVTSSTRIAMVSYMALRVAWTPVSGAQTVTPTTAALVVTPNIPTVTASDHQLVTVPTAGGGYVTAVLADSPVGYWRMGEASGSVLDSIGSNHGTITGGVTRDVTGALAGAQDDGALTFNGTTGYIVVGDVLDITVGSYEVWFKSTAPATTTQYIMYKQAGQPNLYFHTDGSLRVSDNNVEWIITASTAYDDGAWHHAVFTHPGGATLGLAKLYIDGVDVTVSYNGATLTANSSDLGFGGLAIVPFNGSIDEAAIYNTVLSPTRVLAHYNAGITAGGLVLTTFIPTVTVAVATIVTPTTASLTSSTFVPTVTATDYQLVTPTTKAVVLDTFAPTVSATDHQLVTPTTRAVTLTANAPTVTATDTQLVTPTTKALALAAFAPVVTATDVQLVTPATAAIVLSTFAPTISLTDHQLVTPTTKTAVLATFAPTVTAPDHQLVTPSNAAVTLATFAPTVTSAQHQVATPTTATLSTASFAPAVSASDAQLVTPTTKALTLTTNAPTVTTPILATPTTVALVLTKNAPTVSTPETVTPTTKALSLSTFAPTITNPQTYVPDTAALTLTRFVPIVDVTAASTIVVPNATLTITRNNAEVSATAHLAVTPPAVTLTVTQFAPTVTATAHEVVSPPVKSLIAATFAPTVSTSDQQGIVPGKATLTLVTFAPTVSATAHVAVIPSTKVLQLTAFAPTARVANYAIPTTQALTLSQFAPLVSATQNAYVEIVPNALTITEFAPVLSITGHADLVPITAELHLALFPPTAEQHSITPLPINIYGFAVVAMGDSAGVEGENGGATVRSEGGGTTVSTSGPSARVTVR